MIGLHFLRKDRVACGMKIASVNVERSRGRNYEHFFLRSANHYVMKQIVLY